MYIWNYIITLAKWMKYKLIATSLSSMRAERPKTSIVESWQTLIAAESCIIKLLLTLECSVILSGKEINFIYTPIPKWDYTSISKQLSRLLTFQKHRCISCHRAGGFFARSNLLFAESCLLFPCNPQAQSYHELSNCKLLTSQKFASFLRTRKIAQNVLTLNGRKLWQLRHIWRLQLSSKSDLSPSHNLRCRAPPCYGVIFQTTGRAQTGPIKQDRHQRSQEITEE